MSGLHAICAGRVWQEDCADYGTTYSGYPPNPSEDQVKDVRMPVATQFKPQ